jgi:hypothetical protein
MNREIETLQAEVKRLAERVDALEKWRKGYKLAARLTRLEKKLAIDETKVLKDWATGAVVLDITGVKPAKFRFHENMKRPANLPKGSAWPEYTGDKVIWQMLKASKYTVAQIVATVLAKDGGDNGYTLRIAYDSIPIVKGWMKALKLKPEMVK